MAAPASENGASSVTLYLAKFSPFAWRPQLALTEKGIPHTLVHLNVLQKPKELWDMNPVYGMVPVLKHNDNAICESTIILQYLEEAWPDRKPLMPADALARSKVRFWTDFIGKGIDNVVALIRLKLGRPNKDASLEKVSKFFETLEAAMLEYSADGPFFAGDDLGFLDLVLSPVCRWPKALASMLQYSIPGPDQLPRFNKWLKAMAERESVKQSLPSEDDTLDYYESRIKQYEERVRAQAAGQK